MATKTKNLNLNLPDWDDDYDLDAFNENSEILDAAVAALKQNAYIKPSTGIPKTDLSGDVQTSLKAADNAQPKEDGSLNTTSKTIVGGINELNTNKQSIITDLATIRSGAALGATSIQEHQDISGKQDKTDSSLKTTAKTVVEAINELNTNKQDVISDLATIRSGAALGATSIQKHQDISGKQDKTDSSLKTTAKTVVGAINELKQNIVNLFTTATATLSADSWSDSAQTVTVTGVTASNKVWVSPANRGSAEAWSAGEVLCTAQATNKLTFTCGDTVPDADITVNVMMEG